jgi:hypothetical protein
MSEGIVKITVGSDTIADWQAAVDEAIRVYQQSHPDMDPGEGAGWYRELVAASADMASVIINADANRDGKG